MNLKTICFRFFKGQTVWKINTLLLKQQIGFNKWLKIQQQVGNGGANSVILDLGIKKIKQYIVLRN